MNPVYCWKSNCRQDADGLAWTPAEADGHLSMHGTTVLLRLSAGETASVNGLRVVGPIQVIETGDLVYIRRPAAADLNFVVGAAQLVREPGEGRTCQFTGLRIHGESIRCRCGAIYSTDVSQQFSQCPNCGHGFGDDALTLPTEELL